MDLFCLDESQVKDFFSPIIKMYIATFLSVCHILFVHARIPVGIACYFKPTPALTLICPVCILVGGPCAFTYALTSVFWR